MTTRVPLPTGSYVTADPRSSSKRLVGAFSEINPQTSQLDSKQTWPPVTLRRAPGITQLATAAYSNIPNSTTVVRGLHKMAGVMYAVIGQELYQLSPSGVLFPIGAGIKGTGFVRIADNRACLFILVPGTTLAYTYCPNQNPPPNFLTPFLNSTFLAYGALDVWFCDSYFVFLALNGQLFYNDDGQIVSGNGPPTFTTGAVFPREFGTDTMIGMAVDHREILLFGELTSEGYVNTGNVNQSPFASAPDSFMQIGVHPLCGYTVALQDQSVFWVANDRTVRRRNGQTPSRVSNSGIEQILNTVSLSGAYAFSPTVGGHPWWVLTLPVAGRTLVYDCLTTEWFELSSLINSIGYWRPLCYYTAFGQQLVGDSQSGGIGFLDIGSYAEFGSPMETLITTQSVYDQHNRITHRRLEVVITPGESPSLTTGALITLFVSDDGGYTWYARETQNLGPLGQRQLRAYWTNLGQSRDRVYMFQISDPTPLFTVDIVAELDGGKW